MIVVEKVSKDIKNERVLDHISYTFNQGKIYGLKGKNGSGKTMLLRAICGLIHVTEGKVIINDEELGKDMDFPKSVGLLLETPGFINRYTGFQNLKMLADIKGLIGVNEINEILSQVGLESEKDKKYKQYSLGMKQKLGIAAALMEDPDLILLDEPTNALDSLGVQRLSDLLNRHRDRGAIIIIASHDLEELKILSDEIIEMDAGRIIHTHTI